MDRPDPRPVSQIFDDLRGLAQGDGSLHELSALVYRDWVITFDLKGKRVSDDPEQRWSTSKLNKNELMLLLGLLVQSNDDRTFTLLPQSTTFADKADRLFREFHDRVLADIGSAFGQEPNANTSMSGVLGPLAREAIYYGAEGFYLHQFLRFTTLRYREDSEWLLRNTGLSIDSIVDISDFIAKRVNEQLSATAHLIDSGSTLNSGDLTSSLLVSKSDLRENFGDKTDAFVARFSTPPTGANEGFTDPFSLNGVAVSPILDLGEHLYVPIQYRLAEAIYEGPFYWMISDRTYADTAAAHRGEFLERTTGQILRSVFGDENVYENVLLYSGESMKERIAEIDTLVVYGEFVLVAQAKSKRITHRSRSGDTSSLKRDFEHAIQAPYMQAIRSIAQIHSGAKCVDSKGKEIEFPPVLRAFPLVVLSDTFPAATVLSQSMLSRNDGTAPIIWDIGILDCVTRLLPNPIDFLFYLQSRASTFDGVSSDSEYNYLGFHLRAKLTPPSDVDHLHLDQGFASVIDDYMIAADLGVATERPRGILEQLKVPIISEMLDALGKAPPETAAVVIDLYDMASSSLHDLSSRIVEVRKAVAKGKAFKAISVQTANGGLTYFVGLHRDEKTVRAAEAIGSKHKYDTKSDRWYVVIDSIETPHPIDNFISLVWPWQEDASEADRSNQVGAFFGSSRVAIAKPIH